MEKIAKGFWPNPSASAENFKIGTPVKWYVGSEVSPYVGAVTEVCPGINKVWVEFPVGGNQQFSPEDLIIVPPEQGIPFVDKNESSYSNYDKEKSKEDYGTFRSFTAPKLAKTIVDKAATRKESFEKVSSIAEKIAKNFAKNTIDKLANDVVECKNKNMSDVGTYQTVYAKYSSNCSDHIIRYAVEKIYGLSK